MSSVGRYLLLPVVMFKRFPRGHILAFLFRRRLLFLSMKHHACFLFYVILVLYKKGAYTLLRVRPVILVTDPPHCPILHLPHFYGCVYLLYAMKNRIVTLKYITAMKYTLKRPAVLLYVPLPLGLVPLTQCPYSK